MRVETKGERKSRKGGRSIVLVFTDLYLTFIFECWIERNLPFDEFRL